MPNNQITSLQSPHVVRVKALLGSRGKKIRATEREFIADGIQSVREVLSPSFDDAPALIHLYVTEKGYAKLESEIDVNNNQIFKDLDSKLQIEEIFKKYEDIEGYTLSFETDMRAHRNPTRMKVIAETAEKLKRKLQSTCSSCNYPGFDIVEVEKGLPCSICEFPTRLIHKVLYACMNCHHQEWSGNPEGLIASDPGFCDYCNP
jgi:hypothetical protein